MEAFLQQLQQRRAAVINDRARAFAQRQAAIDVRAEAGRRKFTTAEAQVYRNAQTQIAECDETIAALDKRIAHQKEEIRRAGRDPNDPNPLVTQLMQARGNGGGGDAKAMGESWARRTAQLIAGGRGETRAINTGSLDVPSLVLPGVVSLPWPTRLIDLFASRKPALSNAVSYYRQTVKNNLAAPVPDLASKPVSTFTVEEINDRCRVIAHLSEPVPYRFLQDVEALTPWLNTTMVQGVFAGLEEQVVSGDNTGENMQGLMTLPGVTTVAYQGDPATTIRHSLTTLQNLGEQPNGIALNPFDAEELDLQRWGTQGGLLTSGFDHANTTGWGSSNNFFGDSSQIRRVTSPSVPAGTAIIADWDTLDLFVREGVSVIMNQWGEAQFTTNTFVVRAEIRVVAGFTRPQAFCLATITGT